MAEVILHAIIDNLREEENKVFKMADIDERRWWCRASVWIIVARVGLPVTYLLVAIAIIIPGITNIIVQGSSD